MLDVIARIVDASEFHEYKPDYGKTLICGYARIGGWAVGIVANQKETIRHKDKPWETGGVIYHDAADKAARFIMDCNQLGVPLVFLHDVNGFMVGPESEHNGIIRKGAKMVNAMANSVVPKFSIIVGGSFGAGHYAMCGRAYRPRYIAAWPSARYAVMGGDAAANTLLTLQISKMKAQGQEVSDEDKGKLLADIKKRYTDAMAPAYGAARLWLDAIIESEEARDALIHAIAMSANNPTCRSTARECWRPDESRASDTILRGDDDAGRCDSRRHERGTLARVHVASGQGAQADGQTLQLHLGQPRRTSRHGSQAG